MGNLRSIPEPDSNGQCRKSDGAQQSADDNKDSETPPRSPSPPPTPSLPPTLARTPPLIPTTPLDFRSSDWWQRLSDLFCHNYSVCPWYRPIVHEAIASQQRTDNASQKHVTRDLSDEDSDDYEMDQDSEEEDAEIANVLRRSLNSPAADEEEPYDQSMHFEDFDTPMICPGHCTCPYCEQERQCEYPLRQRSRQSKTIINYIKLFFRSSQKRGLVWQGLMWQGLIPACSSNAFHRPTPTVQRFLFQL